MGLQANSFGGIQEPSSILAPKEMRLQRPRTTRRRCELAQCFSYQAALGSSFKCQSSSHLRLFSFQPKGNVAGGAGGDSMATHSFGPQRSVTM